MPPNQVGSNMTSGKTGKFVQKGQTAGSYGNDPSVNAKGAASGSARELKP